MSLQKCSTTLLNQLVNTLELVSKEQYTTCVPMLSEGTIGKHVRHVIEFYECMFNGIANGLLDYDKRQRNLLIETDIPFAIQRIQLVQENCLALEDDQELTLNYTCENEDSIAIPSSYYRELCYNIEHCIHHMAILKIAMVHHFSITQIDANFGVAYSTIQYQQQCAQ